MPDPSLTTFYAALAAQAGTAPAALRPADEHLALGHFNLFDVANVLRYPPAPTAAPVMFDRRSYYKISLLAGSGRATYDDQELRIQACSRWFAPPQLSVQWWPDAPVIKPGRPEQRPPAYPSGVAGLVRCPQKTKSVNASSPKLNGVLAASPRPR